MIKKTKTYAGCCEQMHNYRELVSRECGWLSVSGDGDLQPSARAELKEIFFDSGCCEGSGHTSVTLTLNFCPNCGMRL